MRLVVNLSTLGPRPTGLGIYSTHCARAICASFDADLVAAESAGYPNLTIASPSSIALGAGRAAAIRRWLWLRKLPDMEDRLVYCPTHHGLPKQRNQILTIHDLIALRFPRQHLTQYMFFRHMLPRHLETARAVFTVSEATRQDIHDSYGYPIDAIHVVPNGVDTTVYHPPQQPVSGDEEQPFLLMVGAAYEHKNVEEVLAMADLWRGRYRLLVASCRGKYRARLEARVVEARLGDAVQFLPYLSQAELVRLYQSAAALVYPSKWEGFGIPPLEALACGATVIASDIPAHREVLGTHARFVRLGNEADWVRALQHLPDPRDRRTADIDDPHHPVRHFTWARSAERLVASLLAVEPALAP